MTDGQDFSHDNEMVEILTAMGVLRMDQKLPVTRVPDHKRFILSELVPFGARWAFERVRCGAALQGEGVLSNDHVKGRNTFIRVLIK